MLSSAWRQRFQIVVSRLTSLAMSSRTFGLRGISKYTVPTM